jgi:hypothetical protein
MEVRLYFLKVHYCVCRQNFEITKIFLVIKGIRFYTGIKLGFSFYGKGAQILGRRIQISLL